MQNSGGKEEDHVHLLSAWLCWGRGIGKGDRKGEEGRVRDGC